MLAFNLIALELIARHLWPYLAINTTASSTPDWPVGPIPTLAGIMQMSSGNRALQDDALCQLKRFEISLASAGADNVSKSHPTRVYLKLIALR